jgi:3-dehydroquinate synthase
MASDPHEHREAMVLQYGHTIGHPIEYLSQYSMSHGQAVAAGMMVAAHVARMLGGCSAEVVDLHRRVISRYLLPTGISPAISDDEIIDMLKYNKRYLAEGTRMALVDGPGHLWSVANDFAIPVSEDVLRGALCETRKESCRFTRRQVPA